MPIITIDFTGIKAGGGGMNPRVPEGEYGLKCIEIKLKKGSDSGKKYLDLAFKLFKGNKKGLGKILHHSCSLQPQALWNIRGMLEAMGSEVPSKAIKISTEKIIGRTCGATIMDDEYETKKKSKIASFFPLEDLGKVSDDADDLEAEEEEEPEEEEEIVPKKKKKKVVEEEEEPEEEEEEPKPKKKKRPVISDDEEEDDGETPEPPKKKKKKVVEEEEEPEEEEEEEEPPKKKKKKVAMEEEEEEDADELFS